MDLTHSIPLHSPTPLVSTPFDVSANYEYPFPPDHEYHASSSVASIPIPSRTCRPPSAGSLPMLSGSPPPHMSMSISPPPVSANYRSSPAHPKMRSREPPIPPGLITKRRPMDETRRESNDSIGSGSAPSEDASPMSTMLCSADCSKEQWSFRIREGKKNREMISDGSVDLGKNVRINEAAAADLAATNRRETEKRDGNNTPVPSQP